MDKHGNINAEEGCDRCVCGNKYWENDRCIDCGIMVEIAKNRRRAIGELTMAKQVLSWNVDCAGTWYGLTEVVPWPEVDLSRRLRGYREEVPERPEGTRVVFHGGLAYLIRDVAKEI